MQFLFILKSTGRYNLGLLSLCVYRQIIAIVERIYFRDLGEKRRDFRELETDLQA